MELVVEGNDLEWVKDFNFNCFAIDTETSSLKQYDLELTGISLYDGKYNIYIPIGFEHNDVPLYLNNLITKDSKVIMHNSSFDLRVLKKFDIDLFKVKLFDTMIAAHLIDENRSKSLKSLTREIFDIEVADYDETLQHFCKEFYDYALADSRNTYNLYSFFLPTITNDKKLARLFFQIEMPFQKILANISINGVDINIDKYNTMKEDLGQEVLKLKANLLEEISEPYDLQVDLFMNPISVESNINLNSSVQLINIFNKLGLEITETTPSGNPSVGKNTISKHITNPFVSLLSNYKVANKLSTSFLLPLVEHIQGDGKVRPSFNDVGARTGRLSCSSPNLQQLPNNKEEGYSPVDFRSLFIAPKGYKMITVDYSGQEVAVAAQVSKDPTLVESLKNGYDMHLAIANQFYNLGIPKEALNKNDSRHKEYRKANEAARKKAKTITFGLLFGKGAYGFSKDFGISEDEAQKIVDKYFEGMPILKQSIDDSHKELKKNGFVTNLAGRKRHFEANEQGYYPNKAFRQAFNFKIQGFAADMLRSAMVNTWYRTMRHPEWDIKPIMTVHDEAVYIVKEEYLDNAKELIKQSFEDVCKNFIVPVKADVVSGNSYSEAK